MKKEDLKILFFGTPWFAKEILEKMKEEGFIPKLIITGQDKPKGRKLVITPPEVKIFAQENNIPFLQPKSLKTEEFLNQIKSFGDFDLGVVCSYGKIIPKNILDIPKGGNINVHPSLLPRLRGPSPIQSAILTEEKTGVTIMQVDEEMDHGPILLQKEVIIDWPPYVDDLEQLLAKEGGQMLCEAINMFIDKTLKGVEQNHSLATFCKKIEKEDGLLNFEEDPEINLRKIRAFKNWPRTYFFMNIEGKETRIIVTSASLKDGKLEIEKIIPEGKKEMDYKQFISNLNNS